MTGAGSSSGQLLLEGRDLVRRYPGRAARQGPILAVDHVDLSLARGESLGLAGESGSGKSTLLRLLAGLEAPDAGQVRFDGTPIESLDRAGRHDLRRRLQVVFQDAEGSLDPRLRVCTSIVEPLSALGLGTPRERRARLAELLDLVGLAPETAERRPASLSGGERQRASIARALAPRPEVLLLDEPVSSLDVSVQRRILDLLGHLATRLDVSLLLISHDLGPVEALCDRVAVMLRGRIVETGPTPRVLAAPAHPYTRLLLRCAPRPEPGWRPPAVPEPRGREVGDGSAASARADTPASRTCPFLDRCELAEARCRRAPALGPVATAHEAACWLAGTRPADAARPPGTS
jgi:oligopeptide/dipeptide ABC transporter ATP-binding protein